MKRSTTSAKAAIEHRISGQMAQPASCTILSKSTPSTFDGYTGLLGRYRLCAARLGAERKGGLWREPWGVSTGRTCDYESIGDPHDLWKTLWVTRARRAESREFWCFGLACLKNRQKNSE